jgi:hypothetical protein
VAASDSRWPHFVQKVEPGLIAAWQEGQTGSAGGSGWLTAVPQVSQNLASAGRAVWQLGQTIPAGVSAFWPHTGQNLLLSGISEVQCGHFMGRPPLSGLLQAWTIEQ